MSEWISVKDRLPDHLQRVLVQRTVCTHAEISQYSDPVIDNYYSGFRYGMGCLGNVTHWQPLPAPPESEHPDGE